MEDDLYIIDCGNYLTIANAKGRYENHCHTDKGNKKKQYKSANILIDLVNKKKVPRSSYFREYALRISLDNKYKRAVKHKIAKDKDKQRYNNVGGRRV